MKKAHEQLVKAIEITKKYSVAEVRLLSGLFTYLNNLNIEEEEFKTGISAKWLWKLLNPLTRTGNPQPFREWWESVSNLSRLKENLDYEKKEELLIRDISNKPSFAWRENSQQAKRGGNTWEIPVKETDYILTLRAGEYCAVLTKGDSGDLYRRFIFDIKDEFLRLVFRYGRSIETRNEFTKSIADLKWMKELSESQTGNVYGEMTNLIYLELFGVKAIEFKELHEIPKTEFAKHYFDKDGLFDLEKLERKLGTIISYLQPKTRDELIVLIKDFLKKENPVENLIAQITPENKHDIVSWWFLVGKEKVVW